MFRGTQKRSPIGAVHQLCLECYNGDARMITACRVDGYHVKPKCPIFEYRTGHTELGNYPDVPVLSAIRQFCVSCVGTSDEVRNCVCDGNSPCNGLAKYKCPLFEFRFGANPFTKKQGRSREELLETAFRPKVSADNYLLKGGNFNLVRVPL